MTFRSVIQEKNMEIFLLFYSDPSSLSDVESKKFLIDSLCDTVLFSLCVIMLLFSDVIVSLSLNADFGMAIRIGIFKPCFAKHLERVVDSMEMTI